MYNNNATDKKPNKIKCTLTKIYGGRTADFPLIGRRFIVRKCRYYVIFPPRTIHFPFFTEKRARYVLIEASTLSRASAYRPATDEMCFIQNHYKYPQLLKPFLRNFFSMWCFVKEWGSPFSQREIFRDVFPTLALVFCQRMNSIKRSLARNKNLLLKKQK